LTESYTETFFLPEEVEREEWMVPSDIYNLYHSLQVRSETGNVFVPIRSMQFMAVLDKDEIIFVDSQSYAVAHNVGGRLILVAWQFDGSHERGALMDPVPCQLVFYQQKNNELQLRLISEFRQAMMLLDKRYRDEQLPAEGAKILSLK